MNKIKVITQECASEGAQVTLDLVKNKLGRVPNMYKVMANSPAVLEAYVKFNTSLSSGSIGNKMAELIALSVAETNNCSYCLSAHTFLANKIGLTETEILLGRTFNSIDEKQEIGLSFAKKITLNPNLISSNDLIPLRNIGYTDGEILEIIANVVRNIFTNYINIVAETEVDWPVVVTPLK